MKIRIVTRVVTYDNTHKKILLVKNQGQDFWYPPGGGWKFEKENIIKCAEREVEEETGLKVNVKRLLYVQEFHDAVDSISFESIWLAVAEKGTKLDELHVDKDIHGKVETAKWFSRDEIFNIKVFPERLQNSFWEHLERFLTDEDPFIGVS